MIRKLIASVVLLLILLGAPTSIASFHRRITWPERSGVRVMSFNIRTVYADDWLNWWPFRIHLVCDTIRDEMPDIVALQESTTWQIKDLAAVLPDYTFVVPGSGDQTRGYPIILYRTDRFEQHGTERLWFSEAPTLAESVSWGNPSPRCFSSVRLRDKTTRKEFVVASLHLDYQSRSSREKSALFLAAWVRAQGKTPVILAGDFNEAHNSAVLNSVRTYNRPSAAMSDHLVDSYTLMHQPEQGTLHGFTGRAKHRIDLILVSPEWEIRGARVIESHVGSRYPSDHFPVSCDLGWPEPQTMLANARK